MSASAEASRRLPRWLWLAIGGAALALRLYRLGHFSYWLDEIMQSFFIHGTRGQFWASLRYDAVHPPLDYLFDRAFERLVHPGDALRKLLPAVWGAGAALSLAALLARRAGRLAGAFAGILLALAPFHVRYSQELRPYALGLFLMITALVALDRHLDRPTLASLVVLYLACLATAYTLYLSGIVLGIAAAALLVEDAFATDPERRGAARRFAAVSPLFLAGLAIGYLPWAPVVLEAAKRPSPVAAPPLSVARLVETFGFYAFAGKDGPPGPVGFGYAVLVAAGILLAARRRRLRFLAVWLVGGAAAIVLLEQLHPHFGGSRHFFPAGIAVPAAAALAAASIGRRKLLRAGLTAVVLATVAAADLGGLREYFRNGRPDWRPLAAYLRATPANERIIVENDYAELCVAYYVDGPEWLHRQAPHRPWGRSIVALDGDPSPIAWLHEPGKTAWFVEFHGGTRSPRVEAWAAALPGVAFPSMEGDAIVRKLDAGNRTAEIAALSTVK